MTTATKKLERNEVGRISEQEHNARLAEMVQELTRLESVRYQAYLARDAAQKEEKKANSAVEEQVKRIMEFQNQVTGGLPFDGDEEESGPDIMDGVFDEEAFSKYRLEDLPISSGYKSKLIASDQKSSKPQMATVGDLHEWLKADPGNRIANIPGLGAKAEKKIEAGLKEVAKEYEGKGATEAA